MTTIETLQAKATEYETKAAAETALGAKYNYDPAPAVEGYLSLAAMFTEALGKADTMTETEFATYAKQCISAAWQWEDTIGPDADFSWED